MFIEKREFSISSKATLIQMMKVLSDISMVVPDSKISINEFNEPGMLKLDILPFYSIPLTPD